MVRPTPARASAGMLALRSTIRASAPWERTAEKANVETGSLRLVQRRVLHPHLGLLHGLECAREVLERALAPRLPLEQLVHQVVGVAVVEGSCDVTDAELIFFQLEKHRRPVCVSKCQFLRFVQMKISSLDATFLL